MQERSTEIETKLGIMRDCLRQSGAAMLRLRGTDWFAWATAGGSNTVLLAAETGVAEIAVTVLVRGNTTITSTATATANVVDPNTSNNSASITVSVVFGGGKAGGGGGKGGGPKK